MAKELEISDILEDSVVDRRSTATNLKKLRETKDPQLYKLVGLQESDKLQKSGEWQVVNILHVEEDGELIKKYELVFIGETKPKGGKK